MSKLIGSIEQALLKFEPDGEYWHSSQLNMFHRGWPAIEQFFTNWEWRGYLWEFHYPLTVRCAHALIRRGLVEPHPKIQNIYVPSKKVIAQRALRT